MPARVIVVGGGISGLALAAALRDCGLDPVVLEGDSRLGGTVRTERAEGHLYETGPVGFLDREPATLARAEKLGLSDRLVRAKDSAHARWIWRRGRLWEAPTSPPKFLSSGLLSLRGRLRVAMEPFAGAPQEGKDETVAEFGRRRIGEEGVRTLLDPMVSGVFGGDVDRLSMRSAFPRMVALERDHGSLVRAMIRLGRERRRSGPLRGGSGGPTGPGGTLTSMPGGLTDVIDALGADLGDRVRPGARVQSIEPMGQGWKAVLSAGEDALGDAIVLAIPSFLQAALLRPLEPAASDALESISYASMTLAILGFARADVRHDLAGFGFLAPRSDDLRALGAICVSSVFDGRAPDGHVQIDVRIGGATDPRAIDLPDDRMLAVAMDALGRALGIDAEPSFVRIVRHPRGIPQYEVGHADRVARAEEGAFRRRGLYLSGNALHGVGFNDCVREAEALAERIVRERG